jgi:hypothetical protein
MTGAKGYANNWVVSRAQIHEENEDIGIRGQDVDVVSLAGCHGIHHVEW